jgi:hypothetical protein
MKTESTQPTSDQTGGGVGSSGRLPGFGDGRGLLKAQDETALHAPSELGLSVTVLHGLTQDTFNGHVRGTAATKLGIDDSHACLLEPQHPPDTECGAVRNRL